MCRDNETLRERVRHNFQHEQKFEIASNAYNASIYLLVIIALVKAIPVSAWALVAKRKKDKSSNDSSVKGLDELCKMMR